MLLEVMFGSNDTVFFSGDCTLSVENTFLVM